MSVVQVSTDHPKHDEAAAVAGHHMGLVKALNDQHSTTTCRRAGTGDGVGSVRAAEEVHVLRPGAGDVAPHQRSDPPLLVMAYDYCRVVVGARRMRQEAAVLALVEAGDAPHDLNAEFRDEGVH